MARHRVIPVQVVASTATLAQPPGESSAQDALLPHFSALPPLSLYIHFPWCVRKCPYCDFNSHEVGAGHGAGHSRHPAATNAQVVPEAAYLTALTQDLESSLPGIWGRRVETVFVGGGTPSLLSGAGVEQLLQTLRSLLPLAPEAEITLEANPGTVESGHFAAYREAGVNRLSLGIQSFNPRHLSSLGRIHSRDEALSAVALARRHFDRVNLDLMYGLPGQTLAEAMEDLDTALSLGPQHLSCYQLTLEPNTRFAALPPPEMPDPDLCADMQDAIEARLAVAGYVHYETSAFALPGEFCRHNLNYWLFGDYLGIGPGAHGKLSHPGGVKREMHWKHPEAWLAQARAGNPVQTVHEVAPVDLPFEFMMNALRLNQGFPVRRYAERTGLPWSTVSEPVAEALAEGLLVQETRNGELWLGPSEKGRHFLNALLQRFLAED